jgi:hypothetical protein
MLHPSDSAVEYIWDAFAHCYFDNNTLALWHDVSGITKAVLHRIQSQPGRQVTVFAEKMISRIDAISKKNPSISLEKERDYFLKLL